MAATELDRLTWPEVREQVQAGRDTVVMALGATEPHGRHMPAATHALLRAHRAGEWETSLLLAIHPELVSMERAEAGFTGDLEEAMAGIFASGGVAALSPNGAIGDPARASAEHGRRYWQAATQHALEQIAAA